MTDNSSDGGADLDAIKQLREALERIPNGTQAVRMMTRLGLWSAAAHRDPGMREAFPRKFSDLGPNELADLSAKTVSEAGRLLELVGILNGLEMQLKLRAKATRAGARSRQRRSWDPEKKAPTKAELDDLAEEDTAVMTVDEHLAMLGLLLASSNAAREAQILYKEAVSREITHRAAQMNARVF